MTRELIARVWTRAAACCEYCRMPQEFDELGFEIDHIVTLVHGGLTEAANLALSCWQCNCHKGPNVAGIDPLTRRVVRLFHPRKHKWSRHFAWKGPILTARTAVGRVTVSVLQINLPYRVVHREALIVRGVFPSSRGE